MSDTATDLTPTIDTPPEPAIEPQAQGDGDPTPLNVDDDAAVDAQLDQAAINLPDGDKLVPMSETGKVARAYRQQVKDLKAKLETATAGSAKATQLEQQIQQLSAQVQQLQPYVNAYQAMTQAAQQSASPDDPDAGAAEEYARLLDLYTADGKPDIERGKKGLALQRKMAEAAAQKHVAPLQQQTANQQSAYNLARAKNTTLPNGAKVDPAILDMVWQRIGTELTATPEGAQQALVVAAGYGMLVAQAAQPAAAPARAPSGQFTTQKPLDPPMFTEKAGGKADGNSLPLSPQELKYIKDSGMTEKDYLAATPPWMRK